VLQCGEDFAIEEFNKLLFLVRIFINDLDHLSLNLSDGLHEMTQIIVPFLSFGNLCDTQRMWINLKLCELPYAELPLLISQDQAFHSCLEFSNSHHEFFLILMYSSVRVSLNIKLPLERSDYLDHLGG